jgi:hypothetical protein
VSCEPLLEFPLTGCRQGKLSDYPTGLDQRSFEFVHERGEHREGESVVDLLVEELGDLLRGQLG